MGTSGVGWLAFAEKLPQLGYDIFKEANVPITEKYFADPKVLALTLLARTIANLEGVIAVAKLGLVVEARTLTRCCFENLFLIGGLITRGDEFVTSMYQDEIKGAKSRVNWLLESPERTAGVDAEFSDRLRKNLEEMKRRWPKATFLNPKDAAKSSVLIDGYLAYSMLSGDSAHPSITALKRHFTRIQEDGQDVLCLDVRSVNKKGEMAGTLNLACSAMIGVCVGTNQILGVTAVNSKINAAVADYETLRDA